VPDDLLTPSDLPHLQGPPGAEPQRPAAQLYVTQGPDQGRSWGLPFGAATIGRGAHNTVVLADRGVSTTHAQVSYDGQRFILSDLQSRNGTFVNGAPVQVRPLVSHDVVVMGNTHLVFAMLQ
jgi:pSer/pThr/pTyr-binding forkhead associated (FHA) protein